MTPYRIEGPAVISFSGGRTSAYMLRMILDAHGGTLPPDVYVLFADTGKERPETYDFVRACGVEWGVDIVWIERPGQFTQLITDKKYLPNPIARFCTQELKLTPMRRWMLAKGYDHWTNAVGIRADEPRRIAKMRGAAGTRKERWDNVFPLYESGITKEAVNAFWSSQPFDLQLGPDEGNCDLCFLKGYGKLKNIVRERPDLALWWADQEARTGATFRNDRPSYAAMLAQPDLFQQAEDLIECYCTD